jgi:uncharacterized protein (DUF849 family)
VLADAHGTRFEFECYDVGHLSTSRIFVDEGLVRAALHADASSASSAACDADPENLFLMRSTGRPLFGRENYAILRAGRRAPPDVLWSPWAPSWAGMSRRPGGQPVSGRGLLRSRCSAQVLKIRRILEELSLEIASPDEAREILQTKAPTRWASMADLAATIKCGRRRSSLARELSWQP